MAVLLFIFHVICLFCFFFSRNNVSAAFIKTLLTNAVLVLLVTELLSAFNAISFWPVAASWTILSIGWLFILRNKWQLVRTKIQELPRLSAIKPDIAFLILLAVGLLVQALLFPPTSGDVVCYHLPRLEAWISNHNTNFFATNEPRNLFWPPLQEYILLQPRILARSDIFTNCIQWVAYVGCLVIVWDISGFFGLNRRQRVLSLYVAATISSVIFEATTAQGDLFASFFFLAFFWALRYWTKGEFQPKDLVFGVMALSMSFLAKYTVILFAFFPSLLLLALALKHGFFKKTALWASALIFVFLVSFHVYRVHKTFGTLVQPPANSALYKPLGMEDLNPAAIAVNTLKNIGYHLGIPKLHGWNNAVVRSVNWVSHQLGVDPLDPRYNYYENRANPYPFKCNFKLDEYATSSLVTALLFWPAWFTAIRNMHRSKTANIFSWLGASLVLSFLLYSAVMKYSPFNGRFCMTPLLPAAIMIGWWIGRTRFNWLYRAALILFALSGIFMCLFNSEKLFFKPGFIGMGRVYSSDRPSIYFYNQEEYRQFSVFMEKIPTGTETLATSFPPKNDEYLFFAFAQQRGVTRMQSVTASRELSQLKNNQKNKPYKAILGIGPHIERLASAGNISHIYHFDKYTLVLLNQPENKLFFY